MILLSELTLVEIALADFFTNQDDRLISFDINTLFCVIFDENLRTVHAKQIKQAMLETIQGWHFVETKNASVHTLFALGKYKKLT